MRQTRSTEVGSEKQLTSHSLNFADENPALVWNVKGFGSMRERGYQPSPLTPLTVLEGKASEDLSLYRRGGRTGEVTHRRTGWRPLSALPFGVTSETGPHITASWAHQTDMPAAWLSYDPTDAPHLSQVTAICKGNVPTWRRRAGRKRGAVGDWATGTPSGSAASPGNPVKGLLCPLPEWAPTRSRPFK